MNEDSLRDTLARFGSLATPSALAKARFIQELEAKASAVGHAALAFAERAREIERRGSGAALELLDAMAKREALRPSTVRESEARERAMAFRCCDARAVAAAGLIEAMAKRASVASAASLATSRTSALGFTEDPFAAIRESARAAELSAPSAAMRRSIETAAAATCAYQGVLDREASLRARYSEPPPMIAFPPVYQPTPGRRRRRITKVDFDGRWKPTEVNAVVERLQDHDDLDGLCKCDPIEVSVYRTLRPLEKGGSLRTVTFICSCHRSCELAEWAELSAAREGLRIVDDEPPDPG